MPIATAKARAGYAVLINARHSKDEAEQLCGEVIENGGRAGVVLGDLEDHSAVIWLIPGASALMGPFTLLVNNANKFANDEAKQAEMGSIASLWPDCELRCFLPKLLQPTPQRAAMHRLSISSISASTGKYLVSSHMD